MPTSSILNAANLAASGNTGSSQQAADPYANFYWTPLTQSGYLQNFTGDSSQGQSGMFLNNGPTALPVIPGVTTADQAGTWADAGSDFNYGQQPDWNAYQGWQLGAGTVNGNIVNVFKGPNGQIVSGLNTPQTHDSLDSGDYKALGAIAATAFGLNATGIGADAAAGTAATADAADGISTFSAALPDAPTALSSLPATAGTVSAYPALGDVATVGAGVGGASNLASTVSGASKVGSASDWIQLAQLGLGAYATDKASGAADNASNNAAAVAAGQLGLSQDALNWYKQIYADQGPARDAAAQQQQAISDAQVAQMKQATSQSADLYNNYKTTFQPLEQQYAATAAGYDTPERRAAAASSAAADIDSSAAATQQANNRSLARAGLAPGSAKAMAVNEDAGLAQAVARGSSMTNAVRNVENTGNSMVLNAANLGRNLPTQATANTTASTGAGQAGSSSAGQSLASTESGNALVGTGYSTALSGMGAAGNLYNSIAQTQNQSDQLVLNGVAGIGKLFGTGTVSDKTVKKGTGKMIDAAKALRSIEKTPVHAGWQYDPAKGGPDDGGQPHDGPMAQQVRSNMGESVAPGGKVIDLVSMNGRMMAAIQQLSKEVKSLKAERKAA